MNSHVISTFDATLVIFYLVVINVYGENPINETDRPCCTELKVTSTIEDDTKIHGIGHYKVVNSSASKWVYKMKNGTVHISLNKNHGWTGYPNEPDDADNPALSFLGCDEKCPEHCLSNENWKYYNYETFNFLVDHTLELKCDGGPSGVLVALIIIMVLGTMILIGLAVWKRDIILKQGRETKYINCMSKDTQEDIAIEGAELNDVQDMDVKEAYKFDLNVLHLNSVTLPTNEITLTVSFDEPIEKNTAVKYKWKIITKDDKKRTIGKDQSELRVENLSEGSYEFLIYVTKTDANGNRELATGETKGVFQVYPELLVVSKPKYQIVKEPKANEIEQKLWHDAESIIESLGSDDLKGSVLFQLPKKAKIKKGTEFTVKARPSSVIYVACQREVDFDFGNEWKKVGETVRYTSKTMGIAKSTKALANIMSRTLGLDVTSVKLKTTQEDIKAAVFIVEGTEK